MLPVVFGEASDRYYSKKFMIPAQRHANIIHNHGKTRYVPQSLPFLPHLPRPPGLSSVHSINPSPNPSDSDPQSHPP